MMKFKIKKSEIEIKSISWYLLNKGMDDTGKKRLHGAFTGGFEAGFKNTCGSKHGWAPTKFVSSKSNRSSFKMQSIQDFMDDEDFVIINFREIMKWGRHLS